jgi:hypothetical protein
LLKPLAKQRQQCKAKLKGKAQGFCLLASAAKEQSKGKSTLFLIFYFNF